MLLWLKESIRSNCHEGMLYGFLIFGIKISWEDFDEDARLKSIVFDFEFEGCHVEL